MTVVGGNRTNYGDMYPDVNYPGVSITRGPFSGLPGVLSAGPVNPNGFGAISGGQLVEYGAIALAAWFLWKKFGHKLGL